MNGVLYTKSSESQVRVLLSSNPCSWDTREGTSMSWMSSSASVFKQDSNAISVYHVVRQISTESIQDFASSSQGYEEDDSRNSAPLSIKT